MSSHDHDDNINLTAKHPTPEELDHVSNMLGRPFNLNHEKEMKSYLRTLMVNNHPDRYKGTCEVTKATRKKTYDDATNARQSVIDYFQFYQDEFDKFEQDLSDAEQRRREADIAEQHRREADLAEQHRREAIDKSRRQEIADARNAQTCGECEPPYVPLYRAPRPANHVPPRTRAPWCKFFMNSTCTFGDSCRFSHPRAHSIQKDCWKHLQGHCPLVVCPYLHRNSRTKTRRQYTYPHSTGGYF